MNVQDPYLHGPPPPDPSMLAWAIGGLIFGGTLLWISCDLKSKIDAKIEAMPPEIVESER